MNVSTIIYLWSYIYLIILTGKPLLWQICCSCLPSFPVYRLRKLISPTPTSNFDSCNNWVFWPEMQDLYLNMTFKNALLPTQQPYIKECVYKCSHLLSLNLDLCGGPLWWVVNTMSMHYWIGYSINILTELNNIPSITLFQQTLLLSVTDFHPIIRAGSLN